MIMTLYGFVTLGLIFAFIALCVWAYSPAQTRRHTENANIPFLGEANAVQEKGRLNHE